MVFAHVSYTLAEDDYDALCVSASKQKAVEISVVVDKAGAGSPGKQHRTVRLFSLQLRQELNKFHQPVGTTSQQQTTSEPKTPAVVPVVELVERTPGSQVKKKTVNFNDTVVVRTPTPNASREVTTLQREPSSPALPSILRRTSEVSALPSSSGAPLEANVASPTLTAKKRKRASLDATQEQAESHPTVTESETPAKPKKRKKAKKSRDVAEDEGAKDSPISATSADAATRADSGDAGNGSTAEPVSYVL